MEHILVTGGTGFIGSNLVLELQTLYPDADITVIDDFRSGNFKNLEGFKGDLIPGDMAHIELEYYLGDRPVDVVFHLASITDTTNHNQLEQVFANVESWRNLLSEYEGTSTRIVYASSAATYGIAPGLNKIEDVPKPANCYAFSKVQLDNMARRFARENPKQKVVGLKFFNVYGPREAHKGAASSMILQLAQQMRRGQAPKIFKFGDQKRDFVYVKDILSTLLLAAKASKSGVYNAGSGEPRSFNDIVSNLNRALGTDLKPDYIDNPHAHYQPHTEADLSLTTQDLGYHPQYTLEKGVDDYFASGFLV